MLRKKIKQLLCRHTYYLDEQIKIIGCPKCKKHFWYEGTKDLFTGREEDQVTK